MLEALDRANLFLVPLDDRRALVPLPPPVCRRAPGAPSGRTARTCRTCIGGRARGTSGTATASEAIRHALAGKDFDRAADLIELAIPEMRKARQETTLLRWLRATPRRAASTSGRC